MSIIASAKASGTQVLLDERISQTLHEGLERQYNGQKVLVLIPDHTRSLPLPFLFRQMVEILYDVKQLAFMVALGTHPPLDSDSLCHLVGITREERNTIYKHVGLLNHDWKNPDALVQIGTLTKAQIQEIAGDLWHPSLGDDTPVRINRKIHDYDHIIILGPTFPMVVVGNNLAGLFIGDYLSAWSVAADLSSERHIQWVDKPFKRVLSKAPTMSNGFSLSGIQ